MVHTFSRDTNIASSVKIPTSFNFGYSVFSLPHTKGVKIYKRLCIGFTVSENHCGLHFVILGLQERRLLRELITVKV
jgi:hypothetical protein